MLDNVNAITMAIRHMLSLLDTAAYFALEFVYQLFFNVASANVINGKMIFDLFSRVQLIIGIFMVFLLTINIIKGIINPDTLTDSKSGFGNMITRIVVSLVLLALLVPLNIRSPRNDYEKRINNSGILFGTLYSLQDRILKQNTIGKLIFGNNDNNYTSDDEDADEIIATFSRRFSTSVLKSFYVLKVDDEGKSICEEDGEGYDNIYNQDDLSPINITTMAALTCTVAEENENHAYGLIDLLSPALAQITHKVANALDQAYVVSIIPLLSTIAGIALAVLMFMITFDVAVRVFKLAALQLLAPIPIISYMDPKGGKDTAFNTWVKLLTSTYLDLFIRLGVIYFVISIVSALMKQGQAIGISIATNTGSLISTAVLTGPTYVVLCIGLFIFAKQAPKFIREMLGIKSDKKFFDTFGQALGVGAVGAGVLSGGVSGAVSKYKNADPSMNKGQRIMQAIGGGLSGATRRGFTASREFMNSKDGNALGIMRANRANAEQNWSDAENNSRFLDTIMSRGASNVGLKDQYQRMKDHIDALKGANSAFERLNGILEKDGKKNAAYIEGLNSGTLSSLGLTAGTAYSIKDLTDKYKMMQASGASVDDQEAMDKLIKNAKRIRSMNIALIGDRGGAEFATNYDGERDINGEAAYQEIQTMWKYGGQYKNDEDGVFRTLQNKTKTKDMFTSEEYGNTKAAFGSGATQRANNIENSTVYKDLKKAHERAARKPGS